MLAFCVTVPSLVLELSFIAKSIPPENHYVDPKLRNQHNQKSSRKCLIYVFCLVVTQTNTNLNLMSVYLNGTLRKNSLYSLSLPNNVERKFREKMTLCAIINKETKRKFFLDILK